PYISRGAISTRQVYHSLIERGYDPKQIEKFIQELAWRDYWQQVWMAKGDSINSDLRRPQPDVQNHQMPRAVIEADTGIEAIDQAIKEFYRTGYMHNHVRMYVAAICCTVGGSHWKTPARWMYYHLLDGDWASNALSWQWVAGANSGKQYVANQGNINKYCHSDQSGTFLDIPYAEFDELDIPTVLQDLADPELQTELPSTDELNIDPERPTLIYTTYNLDPQWRSEMDADRILLLEPSHFKEYPISQKSLQFILDLGQNISELQVHVGEFKALKQSHGLQDIYFKEHPFNQHFEGTMDERDWMFSVKSYYRSFFAFWKRCAKEIGQKTLF
ncbi:MAG: deoxyribodipyrimidine photolyase, partial [Flavobacteriales bacterium]|nr:deoxyribodipyrimidine photolyase [Flavobacteriales bacterium]